MVVTDMKFLERGVSAPEGHRPGSVSGRLSKQGEGLQIGEVEIPVKVQFHPFRFGAVWGEIEVTELGRERCHTFV
jgi:hypothetical protein